MFPGKNQDRSSGKKDLVMTGDRILDECAKFRIAEFGKTGMFEAELHFEFHTEPQPVFNKNFELLTEKLVSNNLSGYQTFIISESQSQIDRLRDIFSEINPEVHFTPLLHQSSRRLHRP